MSLRILMIAPEPFFTPRGTPFSILHRLKALSELGHTIDLVTYPFGEDVSIPRVRIYRIPKPPFIRHVKIGPSLAKIPLDLILYHHARRLLKHNHYDLIHTHEEACLMGALWHKKGFRHLYDMHSLLSQQMYNFRVPFARLAAAVWRRLETWAIHHSDAIIAICPELGDALREMGVEQKWMVIENVGVAEFVNTLSDEEIRAFRENQPWKHEFVFGYIGTFEPYQGIPLLLESIRFYLDTFGPDAHWVLVGAAPEDLSRWEKKLQHMQLSPHVSLIPRVDPKTAALYQKAVDVLVTTRISGTNTPLKIYSYLASGTPILATRHPTHTQVLDNTVALLVDAEAGALANAMHQLKKDPDLRNRLARTARERYEREYSYNAYLKKTDDLLKSFIIAQTS